MPVADKPIRLSLNFRIIVSASTLPLPTACSTGQMPVSAVVVVVVTGGCISTVVVVDDLKVEVELLVDLADVVVMLEVEVLPLLLVVVVVVGVMLVVVCALLPSSTVHPFSSTSTPAGVSGHWSIESATPSPSESSLPDGTGVVVVEGPNDPHGPPRTART